MVPDGIVANLLIATVAALILAVVITDREIRTLVRASLVGHEAKAVKIVTAELGATLRFCCEDGWRVTGLMPTSLERDGEYSKINVRELIITFERPRL